MPSARPPLLSVVIPAYNVATYVADAIASALDQSLRDIEVIVVNDGSTDGTATVLRGFEEQRRDLRLRIVHQENGGLAAARNRGIRESRAKFIGFLDADDLWHPEKAAKQVALMSSDCTIGISFSCSSLIDDSGARLDGMLVPARAEPTLWDMIRANQVGNGSSPVVRRSCFVNAGLFSPELRSCEDYEMWCRILYQGDFRAVLLPEPLTVFRLRKSSLTHAFPEFLQFANMAITRLQATMPEVPDRIFREGHAELYRLMAWRAATSGHRALAAAYLLGAFRTCPWFLYHNWRVLATFGAILVPTRTRLSIQRWVHGRRRSA
jgi:glycosyltransferase involved in cell wall biosynthesis